MVRFDIYCIVVAVFVAAVFIVQWVFINRMRHAIFDLIDEFQERTNINNNYILQMHSQLVSITNNMINLFGRVLETDDENDDENDDE